MLKHKNIKFYLKRCRRSIDLKKIFNNKISFSYIIVNQKLFRFSRNLFPNFKDVTLTTRANAKHSSFLAVKPKELNVGKGFFASSPDLSSLVQFNEFFENKGVLFCGVCYRNNIYSLWDFVNFSYNAAKVLACAIFFYKKSVTSLFLLLRYVLIRYANEKPISS